MNVCYLSHPVYGILSWQPKKTTTVASAKHSAVHLAGLQMFIAAFIAIFWFVSSACLVRQGMWVRWLVIAVHQSGGAEWLAVAR